MSLQDALAATTPSSLLLPISICTFAFHIISLGRKPCPQEDALPSYLFPAIVTHGRRLPVDGRNAFSYSVIFLAVDIDSVTHGALDMPLRMVHYGGHPGTKLLGLRTNSYLSSGVGTFRYKVETILDQNGIPREKVGRVWMTSMPSILGYEGANPLVTWYIYGKGFGEAISGLICVILEVHSVFSESHCYVLATDSPLRQEPANGYDLAFTFPRSFHVSPFNSRDGHYRVDLTNPFPEGWSSMKNFEPSFNVFLRMYSPENQLKLTATLTSGPLPPTPLRRSLTSVAGVLWSLLRWPGTLFLVTIRTNIQAYTLHFRKKLALYPRPEPRVAASSELFNPPQEDKHQVGTSLQGQPITWEEESARGIVTKWAAKRAREVGVGLEIGFLNERGGLVLGPYEQTIKIETADSRLYSNLLMSPSPEHFLLLAQERLTTVSDPLLFAELFGPPSEPLNTYVSQVAHSIRQRYFEHLYSYTNTPVPPSVPRLTTTLGHFTDRRDHLSIWDRWITLRVVFWTWYGERSLEWIFRALGGRFVPGQEPWTIWDRAARRARGDVDVDRGSSSGTVELK